MDLQMRGHLLVDSDHPEDVGQPGTGATGQGEADLGQRRPHSFGPLAVSAGRTRDLLHERPPPS
ncbi:MULTISPECIES: hypothetical protein [Streptomyces]|uniref:hypothetical protein n=1 Tax=Streptomyces TaxID=1883 RepID=UPI00167168E9|nr:hypothetical protein [Streptomyces ruber]